MQIIWKENGIIKIVGEKNTVLINPQKPEEASITIDPQNVEDFKNTNTFLIKNPGEYEINEDFVYKSFFLNKDNIKTSIYKLSIDNITILNLNNINQDIDSREKNEDSFEDIIDGNIDILLLPIGEGFLSTKTAGEIKNTLVPKIVIPINYDEQKDQKALADFKSFFLNIQETDKVKLAKKNLQEEETALFILKATH